jgi:hypothetical protein
VNQPRTRLTAPLGALVLLTALPAIAHGLWSHRWSDAADMAEAARRLQLVPRQFGDWKQHGDEEQMPDEAVRELQCAGYFNRRYVNQKLGSDVTVMLMVGPAGPLVRHPPEICYGNRANELLAEPNVIPVSSPDAREHSFRLLRYRNPSAISGEFSVCYGWSADGTWSVPDYPRVQFGAAPLLYKMQLLSTDGASGDDQLPQSITKFLDEFLPLLRDTLVDGR